MVYTIQDTTLIDIADAVREKTGAATDMSPAEMATAIRSIITGGTAAPATCTVTLKYNSFTGYTIYQTTSGWISKFSKSSGSETIIIGSLIFFVADKSSSYTIDSISVSGEASRENSIIQDSSSVATYVKVDGDCTITVRGSW